MGWFPVFRFHRISIRVSRYEKREIEQAVRESHYGSVAEAIRALPYLLGKG